jgi:hypothetical protein
MRLDIKQVTDTRGKVMYIAELEYKNDYIRSNWRSFEAAYEWLSETATNYVADLK